MVYKAPRDPPTQISKIYRAVCALGELPYDQPMAPFQVEQKAGVSLEAVLNYFHYAIFYQNFWPRVAIEFDDNSKPNEKIRIVKKSFPAAFDLYFSPEEAIMLRLVELGAYGSRKVLKGSLKLNSMLDRWLEKLRESGIVEIKGDRVSLTHEGLSRAFETMELFTSLRADCFADIRNVAKKLNHPTITEYLQIRPSNRVSPYCNFAPNDIMCKGGLPRLGYSVLPFVKTK